jgi:hypothetical protein
MKFIALIMASLLLAVSAAYAEIPEFTAKVGEAKKITFKLTNNVTDMEKPFVYVILVKDEMDITQQLSWSQWKLANGEEMRPQQSWVPEKAGEYTIEIFIWSSLGNPAPLSPSLTMKVTVEP